MNIEILSAAGVALLQVICSCFRVMQSWQWGTCWETLHVVDSNRLAHWRWSQRTSWMMGRQSGCGFRLMRTRWRRGERCKCKEIELTRRAGKFLKEQWKCNEIWKNLYPDRAALCLTSQGREQRFGGTAMLHAPSPSLPSSTAYAAWSDRTFPLIR